MGKDSFFGANLLGQDPFALRGENDARIRSAETALALVNTGVWTTWTPTVVQSSSVTVTVDYARYQKVGRMITATGYLHVTGTGTAANNVVFGLPAPAAFSAYQLPVGVGHIYDSSAGVLYPGYARLLNGVNFTLVPTSNSAGNGILGGFVFTDALAVNDEIGFTFTYEVVS